MAPQKCKKKKKKKIRQNFLAFLNAYYLKTDLIETLYSLDFSRPNGKLSENPKTGGFRELFLPENDFKSCSTVNFPKKHPDFRVLEKPTRDMKSGLEFFFTCPSTYELKVVFSAPKRNIFKSQ